MFCATTTDAAPGCPLSGDPARLVRSGAADPIVVGEQVIESKVVFAVLAFMLVYGAALTLLAGDLFGPIVAHETGRQGVEPAAH